MKIAFTICSNNYLPHARVLRNSLIEKNPEYKFYYILVDTLADSLDYKTDLVDDVIPVEQIQIPNFDELIKKYNIIELNTSVKASAFKYLLDKNPSTQKILYFDPDIAILDSLHILENELDVSEIIITPHILTPLSINEARPNENDFLNYGIYNLGFIGLKNTTQITNKFLLWWEERLLKMCYINENEGLFVDQLWINLVPVFFKGVKILEHPGMNMAPWNLHERMIKKNENKYIINLKYDLVFYHFSSFKFERLPQLFTNYDRNNNYMKDEVVVKLYEWYAAKLAEIDHKKYSSINCAFMKVGNENERSSLSDTTPIEKVTPLLKLFKYIMPPIFVLLYNKIKLKSF